MAGSRQVIKLRRSHHLNIGVVIFLIIIIYVIFNVYSYYTTTTIAEYEVGQGTIATNHVYRGLILRDETIVYSTQSGYLNYYLGNASKASVNDIVCSVDTNGNVSRQIRTAASDGSTLTAEVLSAISEHIDLFRDNYDSNNYADVYAFKSDLDSELSQTMNLGALGRLAEIVNSAVAGNTFYRQRSDETGIIVYYTDSYENKTVDTFTADDMNSLTYSKTMLDSREMVAAAEPLYKRINSESWNIVFEISDEIAAQMAEDSHVKIRFCKDDYTITVPFAIMTKNGVPYMNLSLQTAMIRYVNDRFVDVELVISEEYGLKIPNSAITTKDFFTVPKSFFTAGGDSENAGLLIQTTEKEKNTVTLVTPTIYHETENAYYIDNEYVSAGDIVLKSDSTETYTIGKNIDSLVGVYNINKGYAVFKQIDIISQNENYAIVDTKTAYGVALYDHIALDGSKVVENQLVVK